MSFILDALRRAEAERDRDRDRGAVPGVHAQPAVVLPAPAASRRSLRAGLALRLGAAAVLGGAAVALLWWLLSQAALPSPPAGVAPALANPANVPPNVTPAVVPPAAVDPTPLTVVSAPITAPTTAPNPPALPAPSAPIVPAPPAAVQADARPQPWSTLSAEQKREWPVLVVGGAIYSDNAASRFVIINGQVVREGEAAAPGVTVERIGPRSAVLRAKDRRVEVAF